MKRQAYRRLRPRDSLVASRYLAGETISRDGHHFFRSNDSALSPGFAEAVNDAVSLAADRGVERQLRMIIGGVAQQIGLGFELKPRALKIRADHRRVDAVELSDNRACVAAGSGDVIDDADNPAWFGRREDFGEERVRVHPRKLVLFVLPIGVVIDEVQ